MDEHNQGETQNEHQKSEQRQSEKTRKGPVVVDLGSQKKKNIKDLRRGEGSLMRKVEITVDELAASGAVSSDAQVVVVVVKEKKKSKSGPCPIVPVPFFRVSND